MQRRHFLQGAAAGVVATGLPVQGAVAASGDRIRVGLIGCGGRGMHVAQQMRQSADVQFTAVCDVYAPQAERAKAWAGPDCRAYPDFRRLLDDRNVDVVIVATPDHWHAIPTVLACQAGKDVYVEKPLAHNVREGRAMVDAARKHNRIVQVGTQHRSAPHYAEAARMVRSGDLGPIRFVRIWNFMNKYPTGSGRAADSPPPSGLDWEFYLGPAPLVPFNKNRFLSHFRWFWDYAGGLVTDWGTHRFDSMHQVMGVTAPRSVSAIGQRFELKDGTETPDILQATFEYPGFILSYEACCLNAHGAGGRTAGKKYYRARGRDDRPHGEAFYGTNGTLICDRLGFEVYPEMEPGTRQVEGPPKLRMRRHETVAEDATGLHTKNFIDCVRSRKPPSADVEIGHQGTIAAHLANIAYRTQRKIRWDERREQILDDAEATALLSRAARKPWDLIT